MDVTAEGRGLRARDVAVVRDGRELLSAARLEAVPGAVTALMAPSGRGKSSLLRCCVRLLPRRAGEVRLAGVPVEDLDPRELRRRVGLVAQAPAMLPGAVSDNLAHGLAELLPADGARALEAAGLGEAFAERHAADLSGGERMRVAIARALVREPEVLLLDEPTAALDASLVEHLADTLLALAGDGLAVCVATHDAAFAGLVADRPVDLAGRPC